tara:strand:- start:1347 stop:1625 length:279 start_codon:yes stop_codon:yes gene_type:complete
MPIRLKDPKNPSNKAFSVLSTKDGKNLQNQVNTNKLSNEVTDAKIDSALTALASQSSHEKKEATSFVINDSDFTDILEYDFRNTDTTNVIQN